MPRPAADQPYRVPILRTKLHRPPVTVDAVRRSRLHEQMNLGLETPLTLVSAPAGYGKSTLVSHWIESLDHPSAWLSLDVADGDLTVFASYLIAAIRTLFPDACEETGALIAAPKLPPLSVLGGCLVNELDEIDTSFVLILDDYHRIAPTSDVHELIGFILNHPPASLRLVIVTRRDPPLAIASMRASRRLTDMRAKDLRFSTSDITTFLEITAGLSIGEEALANLLQQTEGWAVGLQLVALHLRHVDDPNGFLKELGGGIHHIREYLVQEVLAERSSRMRDWLLRTSILDKFCARLCDALGADDDSDGGSDFDGKLFVKELQRNNLFAISLDDQEEWFRYHHLFRELLNNVLRLERDSEGVAALHTRAFAWFEEQGMIDDAIRHALAAGNVDAATRLVEQHRYEQLNAEQWIQLEHRLQLLPIDAVAANPVLLSTKALIHDFRGQLAEEFALRDQAEALLSTLPAGSPACHEVEGEIAFMNSLEAFLSGDGDRALEYAERAMSLLPQEALHIRSLAVGFRALARQTVGDLAGACRAIEEELEASPSIGVTHRVRSMIFFCLVHMLDGSLDRLPIPALECIEIGAGASLRGSTAAARYFIGVSHYLRNELTEAERYLREVLADRFSIRTFFTVHSAVALASVYVAQGNTTDATRVIELARTHTAESGDSLAQGTIRAFEMDLAVRQGHIAEARRLSMGAEFEPFKPIYFFYVPQLTPVRLLLAENTPKSLRKAVEALEKLEEYLRRTHRRTILIDVLSLQALVLDAQGSESAALGKLAEAVELAEPGGIIRSFIDLGSPMKGLLTTLSRDIDDLTHVEQILSAFGDPVENAAEGESSEPERPSLRTSRSTSALGLPPLEELTNREIDVLELLTRRLQNKEIAARLGISTHTVGAHLKTIYQKLEVHDRRDAVRRAIERGIVVEL